MAVSFFPQLETPQMIAGPAGQLEISIAATPHAHVKGIGVVCHPHPLFGGTMMNKVVSTVFKAMLESGYHACRFNYRGVGRSEGEFGDAQGETEDCLAVINWLRNHSSDERLILAGFSFGAFIAANAASLLPQAPQKLLTIAPAVEHAPFYDLPTLTCPWAVFIPEADEVVSVPAIHTWLSTRQGNIAVTTFPDTSHFFHGQLIQLRQAVSQFLL